MVLKFRDGRMDVSDFVGQIMYKINPFVSNGNPRSYQLDQSISVLRVVG